MYDCIYFKRASGKQPVSIFRDKQPKNIKADIDAKIGKLREYGVDKLLKTAMLDYIGPAGLYELRNRELGWRVAFYLDKDVHTYVLLYGWKKQRDKQPQDISTARHLLKEYLEQRNKSYDKNTRR